MTTVGVARWRPPEHGASLATRREEVNSESGGEFGSAGRQRA